MNHVSRILTYLDSADYQLGAPSGTIRAAARRGSGSSVCGGTREREDEQEEQGRGTGSTRENKGKREANMWFLVFFPALLLPSSEVAGERYLIMFSFSFT